METFTPEQRQALQNAHQQVVQAAAQQAQQAQQELTERARGARRTEAGMTGKQIPLNRTGGNFLTWQCRMAFWIPRASRSVVHGPHRQRQLGDRVRPAALPGLPDSAERESRAQLCVGQTAEALRAEGS